jgi:hypothetical protein
MAGPQHFGEEPFGSLGISDLTEQELQVLPAESTARYKYIHSPSLLMD